MERESIDFDVLFVGGGPACLAGAVRLMQAAAEKNMELEVALIEKGAEIGSHALSGAVLNPVALEELFADYEAKGCPLEATVRGDEFHFLTANGAFKLPATPKQMHNTGRYIVSLSKFTRWLGGLAEEMGVNIFPGFAGTEVLYGEDGRTIVGVRTGDKGLDKDGQPKGNFEPGIDLMAKVTIFGEGARGSLFKQMDQKLGLSRDKLPQVYETGVKEVIQLPEDNYFKTSKGNDIHTMGYPLGLNVPGGGFIYEMKDNQVALGYLVGLGYDNPALDIYEMFMKFKTHPFVAGIVKGGKVLESGARTVSTGSYYTIPQLAVDGGLMVGAMAAMHNAPAIKGIHTAMKSGMLAAEAAITAVAKKDFSRATLSAYPDAVAHSWLKAELYEGRNFAAALAKKGIGKFFHLAAQQVTKGRGLIDPLALEEDYTTLKPRQGMPGIDGVDKAVYDGELNVDKLTGVYLSKALHREDEPCHLVVHDLDLCVEKCYPTYQSPCTRFCPGQVYEIEKDENDKPRLKVNASNCLHCKTCDVKDPYENIDWTCPEGGEGPGYAAV